MTTGRSAQLLAVGKAHSGRYLANSIKIGKVRSVGKSLRLSSDVRISSRMNCRGRLSEEPISSLVFEYDSGPLFMLMIFLPPELSRSDECSTHVVVMSSILSLTIPERYDHWSRDVSKVQAFRADFAEHKHLEDLQDLALNSAPPLIP